MTDGTKEREWRDRAEEYRCFAQSAQRPESRDASWRLVATCEQIAERLEAGETAAPAPDA